jgi:DNA-binding transcriptional ArsR family regulator
MFNLIIILLPSPLLNKILHILIENPKKISEIQKITNLNYRTVWDHIKKLEKNGCVLLEKKEKEPGKPVYVKINKELIPYIKHPEKLDTLYDEILSKS